MGLIAEVSAEIENLIPKEDRLNSLDARLIIDSFNEQIEKARRLCEEEDSLEFLPSKVATVYEKKEVPKQIAEQPVTKLP